MLRVAVVMLLALAARTAFAASDIYLRDTFSSNERYFFEGTVGDSTYTYHSDEGFYEIDAKASKASALATITDAFSDYDLSTEVEFYDSALGSKVYAGALFRYREDEQGRASFYLFAVFPDGYAGVMRMDNEENRRYMFPLKKTDLVAPAGSNRLLVRAHGSRFSVYLNDFLIGEFKDSALPSGGVGLFVSPGTVARFRNFEWRVDEAEAASESPANGPFGWLPFRDYDILYRDDFREKHWREGASGGASFRYTDDGYLVDNSRGSTMSVSYRRSPVADDAALTAVFEDVGGERGNGFGIGFNFHAGTAPPSYYAFVVARDGSFKLFKATEGVSEVLIPWKELPFKLDFDKPVMLAAGFVKDEAGLSIALGVNGKPVATALDSEPLPSGGFALLAAPMVRMTLTGLSLLAFKDNGQAFSDKMNAWMESRTNAMEDADIDKVN